METSPLLLGELMSEIETILFWLGILSFYVTIFYIGKKIIDKPEKKKK
jgi:hypothetical protein